MLYSGTGDQTLIGDLDIYSNLTISGAGPDVTTITGYYDRVFAIYDNGAGTPIVRISGVTISGGDSSFGNGAGINANSADLTLDRVVVSNNQSLGDGGGLWASCSTVTIINSVFENNQAGSGVGLELEGGGCSGPVVSISTSRIANNPTYGFLGGDQGGGIRVAGAALTLTETTVQSNSAKVGGGIYVADGSPGPQIIRSAILDNTSSLSGAGIEAVNLGSPVSIENSTIAGNTGDAIVPTGTSQFSINFSTIANNSGRGIIVDANVSATNTIIANNSGGNCTAPLLAGSNNNLQFGDSSCGAALTADPLLDARGTYGGPTEAVCAAGGQPGHRCGDQRILRIAEHRPARRRLPS